MIYEVTLKQTFPLGERILTYKNYISSEENPLIDDEEYGISPESLAVELSMLKFFKEHTMLSKGSSVEIVSIKALPDDESEDEAEEDIVDYLRDLEKRIVNLEVKIDMAKEADIEELYNAIQSKLRNIGFKC